MNLNEIVQTWEVLNAEGTPLKRSRDTCNRDDNNNGLFMEYEKMSRVSVYPEDLLEEEKRDPLEKPKLEREEGVKEFADREEIIKIKKIFEVLMKPLEDEMFIPNAEMEQIDEDLEAAYHMAYSDDGARPTRENGVHEEEEEEKIILYVKPEDYECVKDNTYNKEMIKKYSEILKISESEAFELLRRCHYCGTGEMEFGQSYCSARCQDYHFDYDYPCYWNQERWQNNEASNCKMCNWNDCYKNPNYFTGNTSFP